MADWSDGDELFAAVPDRCVRCDNPLDLDVRIRTAEDKRDAVVDVQCSECGWSNRYVE